MYASSGLALVIIWLRVAKTSNIAHYPRAWIDFSKTFQNQKQTSIFIDNTVSMERYFNGWNSTYISS